MINNSIIESKYKRSQVVAQRTFIYDEIPPPQFIIDKLSGHKPALYYYKCEQYFWFLDNECIIIYNDGVSSEIRYIDISNIILDHLFSGETLKKENDLLLLKLRSGEDFSLKVEPTTWHIIYEIIRWLVNRPH